MGDHDHLDAHAKPPTGLRQVYKAYHRTNVARLQDQPDLIQFDEKRCASTGQVTPTTSAQLPCELRAIFMNFLEPSETGSVPESIPLHLEQAPVYRVPNLPGKICGLYLRLGSMLRRVFQPKDPNLHKPLSTTQFLDKKLRWCTLGGQYDWTAKQYPSDAPPAFPADTKALIESLFPMKAEAAIVNLYSPGDTLSLHRDVSEECAAPLVSISLGCDAIFMCGLEKDGQAEVAVMRLRSGDAVLMSGESRYAWHGVPKIIEGTCPSWMRDWPGKQYDQWEGWMSGKRVNLNVRQMFE